MAHILSYGSLNLDLVYQVPHFVQAGETLSSTSRTVHCGGKGLNQSVALARAGVETWPPHGPGERSATPERSAETAPS